MRIRVVVLAALAVFLVAAAVAEAQTLSIHRARHEIRRDAEKNCSGSCTEITVNQCRRLSSHRVSCHARADIRDGSECTWLATAILKPSSKVRVRIRHEVCGAA